MKENALRLSVSWLSSQTRLAQTNVIQNLCSLFAHCDAFLQGSVKALLESEEILHK